MVEFFLFFCPFGRRSLEAEGKKEPKCDFDDPYTVLAWFFMVPGAPLGTLWEQFWWLFGPLGVAPIDFLL